MTDMVDGDVGGIQLMLIESVVGQHNANESSSTLSPSAKQSLPTSGSLDTIELTTLGMRTAEDLDGDPESTRLPQSTYDPVTLREDYATFRILHQLARSLAAVAATSGKEALVGLPASKGSTHQYSLNLGDARIFADVTFTIEEDGETFTAAHTRAIRTMPGTMGKAQPS